jgi:hypothetical protein
MNGRLSPMTFKKGDRVRTEDGHMGEILFVDNDGVEAQVALERVTMRLRTDTLRVFDEKDDAKVVGVSNQPLSLSAPSDVRRSHTRIKFSAACPLSRRLHTVSNLSLLAISGFSRLGQIGQTGKGTLAFRKTHFY